MRDVLASLIREHGLKAVLYEIVDICDYEAAGLLAYAPAGGHPPEVVAAATRWTNKGAFVKAATDIINICDGEMVKNKSPIMSEGQIVPR